MCVCVFFAVPLSLLFLKPLKKILIGLIDYLCIRDKWQIFAGCWYWAWEYILDGRKSARAKARQFPEVTWHRGEFLFLFDLSSPLLAADLSFCRAFYHCRNLAACTFSNTVSVHLKRFFKSSSLTVLWICLLYIFLIHEILKVLSYTGSWIYAFMINISSCLKEASEFHSTYGLLFFSLNAILVLSMCRPTSYSVILKL